jgi:hypothetical protein
MAKSLLLPLCFLFIVQGLRAQDNSNADVTIPQKLELRKASIGWADQPTTHLFAKKAEEGDTARSILYLGPPKQDSFDLNLPKMQASGLSLRASMHRPLPLFRIQQ